MKNAVIARATNNIIVLKDSIICKHQKNTLIRLCCFHHIFKYKKKRERNINNKGFFFVIFISKN